MAARVFYNNQSVLDEYEEISQGDVIVGRLKLHPGEEHILLDLTSRGVALIPSALSQLCSRSKVFQVRILKKYMLPGTRAVYSLHDLMQVVTDYGKRQVGKVVCKLDRANGGRGILLYQSIEDAYTHAVLGTLRFPFVVQPFIDKSRDVRVVVLGDYMEAYMRHNPDNFRHNLHCGGRSSEWEMDVDLQRICEKIMQRADFPYACIDLLIDQDGKSWMNEVNLRGGLRGAKICQNDYLKGVEEIHTSLLGKVCR